MMKGIGKKGSELVQLWNLNLQGKFKVYRWQFRHIFIAFDLDCLPLTLKLQGTFALLARFWGQGHILRGHGHFMGHP